MAADATAAPAEGMAHAALFRLLAWLSPSYPVGAFGYSHGLEHAVEAGLVADRDGLAAWIAGVLRHGAGRIDAALLAEAWRAAGAEDGARLDAVAALAAAWRGTAETALESRQQGASFLAVTRVAWPHPALEALAARREGEAALPVAVGAAGGAHGVPLPSLLAGHLHAFAANLVSAALRLGVVGQTGGQLALAALEPVVAECAARALADDALETAGSAAPLVDWCSIRHETQHTRLFRS